jgi:HEAT repeat protein
MNACKFSTNGSVLLERKRSQAEMWSATMLEDSNPHARWIAMRELSRLGPATIAQHADAVVARLNDSERVVRELALHALAQLEPATLTQHAETLVAMLEDAKSCVRKNAVELLFRLEPAMLARHADALVARLGDSDRVVRKKAFKVLAKLEPAKLAQHADALVEMLAHPSNLRTRTEATNTLNMLPRSVSRGMHLVSRKNARKLEASRVLRRRLLARLGWYRCRLRLRVERLALYWYALPYRPSGQGYARDVEDWNRMMEEQL